MQNGKIQIIGKGFLKGFIKMAVVSMLFYRNDTDFRYWEHCRYDGNPTGKKTDQGKRTKRDDNAV